jgi:hypothetical protein
MLGELRKALGALSLPGPAALATLPDGCAKADELALDYAYSLEVALDNVAAEFTVTQQQALKDLNDLLGEMSGAHQADLWTETAVLGHPKWVEIRERAREVQRLLGWSVGNGAS